MHNLYETLEQLCETVSNELSRATDKLGSGTLSAGDTEYIDKLTHTLKSIKTVMAMMDSEEYSRDSGMYPHTSYARGRSAMRDSRGRYSGRSRYTGGYSMDSGEMVEELRGLMNDATDDRMRLEFQKFISKIENM